MHLFKAIFGQSKKKPDDSTSPQGRFSRIILYLCIAFFVIAVIFVSFTFNGKWQAGLIEVGGSIFLFVIFLHILKVIIPQSSGIIITTLSILIAVILVCANLSLQRSKNKEYSFNELLVGDLLLKKLVGKYEEQPDQQLAKRIKNVIPGSVAQTKTEKDTIESTFEKPEKDLMGEPVTLPINKLSTVSIPIHKGRKHSFYVPEETVNYKLEVADKESLRLSRTRIATAGFTVQPYKPEEQVSGIHTPAPLYLPPEGNIDYSLLERTIYSKPEQPVATPESEIQPAPSEEHIENKTYKQVEEKLQKQKPTGE
ncbi:MAG: hypothetical protein R2568_05920 [Candidatus Scalindua sp.]|jgi:hypothetical protein|nr:hypothetical protein [Candidatus Scalindua sp.]MDV5166269.1 hypothetical protein [Candidatus Scalindua sp.]